MTKTRSMRVSVRLPVSIQENLQLFYFILPIQCFILIRFWGSWERSTAANISKCSWPACFMWQAGVNLICRILECQYWYFKYLLSTPCYQAELYYLECVSYVFIYIIVRLEDTTSQLVYLTKMASVLRRTELTNKQKLEQKCNDLKMAESEVMRLTISLWVLSLIRRAFYFLVRDIASICICRYTILIVRFVC